MWLAYGLEVTELGREPAPREYEEKPIMSQFLISSFRNIMVSFNASVLASMTIGGTIVSTCLWNRPYYGLFSGVIQSVITIAIKELFGKTASAFYIGGVVIYSIGVIGREVNKKNTSEIPKNKP
jgi:hypothetical protein